MDATQMAAGKLSGSLIFAEQGGVTFSGGLINGRVALRGPLSPDTLSLGVALKLPGPCWHWLTEVKTGDVGVFHGGDEHDALYTPGSLYVAATISADQLEDEAAKDDLVLDRAALGGTGIHHRSMSSGVVATLAAEFARIHAGQSPRIDIGPMLLRAFISHLGRLPYDHGRRLNTNLHAKIAAKARAYILEHLADPIALDDIAAAACSSRRTLYRAFADIFDDTPQTYVRRLRLHRIRQGLAGEREKICTIAVVANQWGISELGRLAGWYRQMFGELPSETLASAKDNAEQAGRLH
ncbi:helix-turn-helix domain-containing protein [Rhizobium sp. 18055]|uniref:helix-turn-helix domain-containing protein n=1 Tax=Rhizobium sp. 18055 TaxID=2681403 RepID=UPI00135C47EC|nr:helix-turn-helix domain-containing protein [Rhizobium sp. 18055]